MTLKQKIVCIAATSLMAMSTFTGLASAANGNASTIVVASAQTEVSEPSFLARLFGTARDTNEQKISYEPHYGSASYICSPSGFGMRSSCSRRGY